MHIRRAKLSNFMGAATDCNIMYIMHEASTQTHVVRVIKI